MINWDVSMPINSLGSWVLLPVGFALAGWATDQFGAPIVFLIGGAGTILIDGPLDSSRRSKFRLIMKIGIVTNSTSDLPAYLIEQHELTVVPTLLILEGKEYADGIGITREEFYNRMPALRTPPTTAAPSIGDFTTPYEALLSRGCDHILSIHAASKLTTTLNGLGKPQRIPGQGHLRG